MVFQASDDFVHRLKVGGLTHGCKQKLAGHHRRGMHPRLIPLEHSRPRDETSRPIRLVSTQAEAPSRLPVDAVAAITAHATRVRHLEMGGNFGDVEVLLASHMPIYEFLALDSLRPCEPTLFRDFLQFRAPNLRSLQAWSPTIRLAVRPSLISHLEKLRVVASPSELMHILPACIPDST